MFLRNKPAYIEYLGKGVKNVFNKSKMIYGEEIGSIIVEKKAFSEQINGWFQCNGNTGLKCQRGCMFKVNMNL